MFQRFKQCGLQLLADDGNGEHRIAAIGIPAHDHAPFKEQGDRSTCRRGQVGRQPALSREADKTQYARGGACSVRAIATTQRRKQAGQTTRHIRRDLTKPWACIVGIAVGVQLAHGQALSALGFIHIDRKCKLLFA